MSVPKVAWCVPYYRHVEGDTMMAAIRMAFVSQPHLAVAPIQCKGCYIEDNRNGAIEYALGMGVDFDWVFWMDTDMIFPGDALLRLIAADKDIVGVNYRQRTPPYAHVGVYQERPAPLMQGGLHRMVQMPTGLLLTRFDIYRKMGYPWFKPGMHNEPRDDIYFCRKATEMGYEIWCDNDLTKEVRHITQQEIPWFQPEQLVEVADGAEIDNVRATAAAKLRAARSAERFQLDNGAEEAKEAVSAIA